jgi:hypothetical protein
LSKFKQDQKQEVFMSANKYVRGFLFFLVLMLTSAANLLFVAVDSDGDESTPPVIVSFKFVKTPASPSPKLHSHTAPDSVAKDQPHRRPPTAFFANPAHFATSALLSLLTTPLRC